MREKVITFLRYGVGILLILSALLTLINGINTVILTSGTVFGTEFAMLIGIANLIGYTMVTLALYVIYKML